MTRKDYVFVRLRVAFATAVLSVLTKVREGTPLLDHEWDALMILKDSILIAIAQYERE